MISAFSSSMEAGIWRCPGPMHMLWQSMASTGPSTAPTAKRGLFDLVWECLLASLPFEGAFLTLGLLCGKGLYDHNVSLAGRSGHVVWSPFPDGEAMVGSRPAQLGDDGARWRHRMSAIWSQWFDPQCEAAGI